MNGKKVLHYVLGIGLILIAFLSLVSCSPYEQVEITVSSNVKKAIEDATPKKYSYYALETAHPEQVEDLAGMTLLVCGDTEPEIDIEVAASSITAMGTPLFQASKVYVINENLITGGATMTEDISFNLEGEEEAVFHREILVHASSETDETLLEKCIEAMRQHPKTVLLTKKGALGRQDGVVEIVFK
jgi:hypothetical protein